MASHDPSNPGQRGDGHGFRLILTEKPSVARDIAGALGQFSRRQGYLEGRYAWQPDGAQLTRIGWCLGHLVQLAEPDAYNPAWRRWRAEELPMLPEVFRLQPRTRDDRAAQQWEAVRGLLADPALVEVINACDAGREGELIFAYAYQLARCPAPVRRLWISSLTEQAIRDGFARLRDGAEYAPLEDAARCRSEADWLVGLNATRAMTLRNERAGGGARLTIGRVQTPTLALIVDREREIRAFEPQTFWKVILTLRDLPLQEKGELSEEECTWEATWRRPDGPELKQRARTQEERDARDKAREEAERVFDQPEAEALLERVRAAGQGTVTKAQRRVRNEPPPLLYDLTTLQREANKRFGFSAQRTLDLAQRLYEQHKLLTYPRTDSRHLPQDQVTSMPGVLAAVSFGPYQQTADAIAQGWPPSPVPPRVFDDAEVGDHHAIIPTTGDPRACSLGRDEKLIYDLVVRRLLGAFLPDARFATAYLEVEVATGEGPETFCARGRSRLDPGWQTIDPPHKQKKEKLLPPVEVGHTEQIVDGRLKEGQTRPPSRFTEASLLGAMERAGNDLDDKELRRAMKERGLGTPATRASIIEKLIDPPRCYVRREGKTLHPTERGEALIGALPDQTAAEALRSARLTGEWEARLAAMADGRDLRPAFMAAIRDFTAELVQACADAPPPEPIAGDGPGGGRPKLQPTGEPIAPCPRCKEPVVPDARGWHCTGCDLRLWSEVAHRPLSASMARALLTEGRTKAVKGFNRHGKPFRAALVLGDDNKVSFEFPEDEALGDCPVCHTPVRRRGGERHVFTCDTGRSCPFVVFGDMSEKTITEELVRGLLADGRSEWTDGFRDKQGHTYGGVLVWDEIAHKVRIEHVDRRQLYGVAGACPRCAEEGRQGEVSFHHHRWRCASCRFSLPGAVMERELTQDDVSALLTEGRTPRLHGFRQKGGAFCKAAMVLGDDGRVAVDFTKPADEAPPPIPEGGPPPAFGERTDCPLCLVTGCPEPGYVIRGHTAWGCSRWRQGCRLQIPFVTAGRAWADDEVRRVFGKHRASRYLKGFLDDDGAPRQRTWRLVIDPGAEHGWTMEERRARAKSGG